MDYFSLIENSLSYIEEHLDRPPSLDELADRFNLSKFYFHRLFAAVMGTSLNQYVGHRRINASIGPILDGRKSLTDIALDLGYSDQSAFTRAFKRIMGVPPKELRSAADPMTRPAVILPRPIPGVVRREVKNFAGDLVTDFTLEQEACLALTGIVWEVDLADPNYKEQIRQKAGQIDRLFRIEAPLPSYMVYSACQPDSSRFKALYGVPARSAEIATPQAAQEIENLFTIEVPSLFCASFRYHGDLLEISDVFTSDFARFIKLSKLDPQDSHIELIQAFEPGDRTMEDYRIRVPIVKTAEDLSGQGD